MKKELTDTQKRVIRAVSVGIKMSAISRRGVSPYKLTALINSDSYRVTSFSESEDGAINAALDEIKAAL